MLALALAIFAGAALACPPPERPVVDYSGQFYYYGPPGDSKRDPEKYRRNAELRAPIYRFLDSVLSNADEFVFKRDEGARACAMTWLDAWAHGNAFLGRVTEQGRWERQWTLASAALGYIKLGAGGRTAVDQRIERWMHKLAREVVTFDREERVLNNHHYYAGLAVGATGVAFKNDALWDYARKVYHDALAHMREDGALPLELERGNRAANYHQFAAGPLVTLARLSRLRGEDFFALGGGRIHRLVELSVRAFHDPNIMTQLNGSHQIRIMNIPWWPLYATAFPKRAAALPEPRHPPYDRHLGGGIAALDAVLPLKR
jgi:poly(beta-D-mannuronate) lyase